MLQWMSFSSGDTVTNEKQIKYIGMSVQEPERRKFPTHFFLYSLLRSCRKSSNILKMIHEVCACKDLGEEGVQFRISILLISKNAAEKWISFMEFQMMQGDCRVFFLSYFPFTISVISNSVWNWSSDNKTAFISFHFPSPSHLILFYFSAGKCNSSFT